MGKTHFILIFFLLLSALSFAQEEFAHFDLPMAKPSSIIANQAPNGDICYAFKYERDYFFVILLASKKILYSEKIHENASVDPYFCGTLVSDSQFIFYNRLKFNHDIFSAHIIYRDEFRYEEIRNIEINDRPKEENISVVNTDKEFYVISISKRTGSMFITSFTDATNYVKKEFKTDLPESYKHFKKESLIYINSNKMSSIYQSHFSNKIYLKEKTFYFTFKNFPGKYYSEKNYTEILMANWETGESNYTYLVNSEAVRNSSFNTDIYKDHLIQLTINKDMLGLAFYTLPSMQQVSDFQYRAMDKVEIMGGPLVSFGLPKTSKTFKLEIQNTMEITRLLSNGFVSICSNELMNGLLELEIGSFKPENNNGSYLVLGGMVGGAMGAAVAISLNSSKESGTRFFPSIFEYPHLRNIKVENYKSVKSQLREYISYLRDSGISIYGDLIYFPDKNNFHYGYIDRKEKTFRIVEFTNN